MMRKGGTAILTGSVFGIVSLAASLIIIIKKGPFAGAILLLLMAVVLFGVSILEALVNWKKHKDG